MGSTRTGPRPYPRWVRADLHVWGVRGCGGAGRVMSYATDVARATRQVHVFRCLRADTELVVEDTPGSGAVRTHMSRHTAHLPPARMGDRASVSVESALTTELRRRVCAHAAAGVPGGAVDFPRPSAAPVVAVPTWRLGAVVRSSSCSPVMTSDVVFSAPLALSRLGWPRSAIMPLWTGVR
jgi:hypothetical protein